MEIMINLKREEADKVRGLVNEVADKEILTFEKKAIQKGELFKFRGGRIGTRYVASLQVNDKFVIDVLNLYEENIGNLKDVFVGAKMMMKGYINTVLSFIDKGESLFSSYLEEKKAA